MTVCLRGSLAFDLSNMVIAAHVADCVWVLRIDGIKKLPLLGIMLAHHIILFQGYFSTSITQGCHLLQVAVETSLCFVGLKFEGLIFASHFFCKLKQTTCYYILTTVCITTECHTINHSDAHIETTAIAVNIGE